MEETIKWTLTALSLAGSIMVAGKAVRLGFLVWIVANVGWCGVWLSAGEWPAAALFAAYFVVSVYGFLNHKSRKASAVERLEFDPRLTLNPGRSR